MNINIRSLVLIGIALVVAAVTALLARNLVGTPSPQISGGQQVVNQIPKPEMQILVAAENMAVGHFIKADDLVWQSWPDKRVNKNYIRKTAGMTPQSFNGAVVNSAISAGEPILENRLVKPGDRGFMAAILHPGMRAISIGITPITGNAGFIFPGDRVDIMLDHEIEIKNNIRRRARVSETILYNIRVLAINQRTGKATHTPALGQTATLEVTPKQAEKLTLMKNMGEVTLSLRSLSDKPGLSSGKTTITWDSDISRPLAAETGQVSSRRRISVQVFRGGVDKSQKLNFNSSLNKIPGPGKNSTAGVPRGEGR